MFKDIFLIWHSVLMCCVTHGEFLPLSGLSSYLESQAVDQMITRGPSWLWSGGSSQSCWLSLRGGQSLQST